ncbi:MAG: hypothetical protein ABII13_00890 [Patescibacteria group bacterium]|nr:hypothetical protein [Patescibacteria group bacterium]MBU2509255.1 hypothetical protein [Patescibacteria group bacterium]
MPDKNKRSKIKYGEVTKAILGLVAVAGLVSVFVLMPGLAKAVPAFRKRPPAQKKKHLRIALKRLEKRGLIQVRVNQIGEERVKVTSKGHEEFVRYALKDKKIKKPKRWDKKWRVVMFDVPEKYKSSRDHFRRTIQSAGFIKLQRSAWIYPYPCEEIIELVSSVYRMSSGMVYLTCSRFSVDEKFIKHYKLKIKN